MLKEFPKFFPVGGLRNVVRRRALGKAALAVLGYSQGEINLALKGIDLDGLTLEQIIKAALKKMIKG